MQERKTWDTGRHLSLLFNGWVDWDRKMETMMGSADAKKLLGEIFGSLPAHRRKVIDEEVTYSDLSETVHHLKIMIKIKPGWSEEQDFWPKNMSFAEFIKVE